MLPSFPLREPSPLLLRPTALHWPMKPNDAPYPLARKQLFARIVAPFTAYCAMHHSHNPLPPPAHRITLESTCIQCRLQALSTASASSPPVLLDCWILHDNLIFPAQYDGSCCPFHKSRKIVDGYSECVIRVSPKLLVSELLLDFYFDYFRLDGSPSFNVFAALVLCSYKRNKEVMPWLGDPASFDSFINKLDNRFRSLIEKVRILDFLSPPQYLLLNSELFFLIVILMGLSSLHSCCGSSFVV